MPASLAALRRILAVPRVVGVELAYLFFIATEFGTWVALLVHAYRAVGPEAVGIVAVALLVPAAVVAPFTSTLGRRLGGSHGLALSYAALGIVCILTGAAMLAGLPALVVVALAMVQQAALTSVRPLQAAILPELVGTAEQLTAANALSMILEGVGGMLGPLGVAFVIAVASPGGGLVVGGLSSLVGAILVVGAARSAGTHDEPAADEAPGGEASFLEGARTVAAQPSGLLLMALIGLRKVTAGALDVVLVIASIELLGMGDSGAGYLGAAVGLGVILGGATTLGLTGRNRIARFLLIGAIAWGIFLVTVATVPSASSALILLAAAGTGLAVLEVTARTLLQRILPVEALTPSFAVLEGIVFAGLALGALVSGPLVAVLGVERSLAALGLLLPLAALVVLPVVTRAERSVHLPLREIGLLRGLRLFAPVPASALEAAARRVIPVEAAPGEAVIREGEVGDRFYVVASGEVAITIGDREVRRLGPGESFGEIALLRRVPRTATVTATSPSELLALERDDFLVAMGASGAALERANRSADELLQVDRARGSAAGDSRAGGTAAGGS